jgi:hypothetical protein
MKYFSFLVFTLLSFILQTFLPENSYSNKETEILSPEENLEQEIKENDDTQSCEGYKDFSSLFPTKHNSKNPVIKSKKVTTHKQKKKEWTILIYIAGVNDLYTYALRNIAQMTEAGSTHRANILIHFDFHIKGQEKQTRRFYVEKGTLLDVGNLRAGDSGDPRNLINSAEWAIKNYPSEHFALVLWNHGTGPCNPSGGRNPANANTYFYYDQRNNIISINKNQSNEKEEIENKTNEEDQGDLCSQNNNRGICFDYTTGSFLTDDKLAYAFRKITDMLKKKIDLILCDACLMQGIETATLCAPYAHYLIGSEEVVLAAGYNYQAMLKKICKEKVSPYDFALHIVKVFQRTYAPIISEYTQSAINLDEVESFNELFTRFVQKIITYMDTYPGGHLKKILKTAGSREFVTSFSEPAYVDFQHLLNNIIKQLRQKKSFLKKSKNSHESYSLESLEELIVLAEENILPFLKKMIIMNIAGRGIPEAGGIFIYFPRNEIERSYKKNSFAQKTNWLLLIEKLLQ